nr:MAG TPA: hypothetical protein [Inoviridae sp.]
MIIGCTASPVHRLSLYIFCIDEASSLFDLFKSYRENIVSSAC